MNVFLLVEEYDQDAFLNKRKESACPFSTIVGVYLNRERAEKEKKNLEDYKENTDKHTYIIEERPVL